MSKDNFIAGWFLAILLAILVGTSKSTPFSPIEAGTFYITVDDLKGLNVKTTKQIQLQTPWEIFDQNLNINVACVIGSINIDERVALEWNYNLTDRQGNDGQSDKKKILFVEIVDKKGFIYPDLMLEINFMVAQNLRSDNYNMTDFQEHLMNQSLTPQQGNPSNKEVHNEVFLFPNGFSSINLTHHIMYSYITPPYDMYTIHYMTGKGEHHEQGWVPGKDFIYFRWILHPKYQFGLDGCPTVYETHLDNDYYFNCYHKGVDGYFFGLSGYSSANFAGNFQFTRNGFAFKVKNKNNGSIYNILAIPFKISEKFEFIDNRYRPYDYVEEKGFFWHLITAVVILVIVVIGVIVILKKKKIIYFDLQEEKGAETGTSSSEFGEKRKQGSQGKKLTNPTFNSDHDEMKEQPFNYSEFRSEVDNKNDNFTIE